MSHWHHERLFSAVSLCDDDDEDEDEEEDEHA